MLTVVDSPNSKESKSSSVYQTFAEFDKDYKFTEKCGFSLSDLQVNDTEQFATWDVSGNFYEVGGGKTVCATAVSLMRQHDLTIVTVPPILITPWVRWLNKVSENVIAYRGTPKERVLLEINTARWIVVSHSLFRSEFAKLMKAFSKRDRAEVIVDESQAIKNIESKLFQTVQAMSLNGSLQMLSGTPISKPLDAYAYIALKTPKLYRSYGQFENLYVAERNFFKVPTAYQDLDVMAKHFALQTITRTKLQLHGYNNPPNFPDCTYELSTEHSKLYEKLVDEQILKFDNGQKIDASTAVKLYHAVQQIIANFEHFSNNPEKRSTTFDLLDLTIEQTNCNDLDASKLIVWTNYKMTSARVLAYLVGKGFKAVAAYGGANSEKSVEAFMHDPSTRILVAQYQSAGAGLNPQEVCWESIFFELTTVPIYMRQALGRIDRLGQKHIPTQRIFIAQGTVQEALIERLLSNDDRAVEVETTKESLRKSLLGNR
jgi:SNF2 family DNA or RNA helicase